MKEKTGAANQLNSDRALRDLIADIIRQSPKKRPQLAEELSEALGQHITSFMLDCFTATGKSRFPAIFIQAFSDITGDDRLQRFVMGPRLRRLVEFAEAELSAARDECERAGLREELLGELQVRPRSRR
jgi:hypothetical protein